jgi:hypothetical protein
LKGVVYRLAKMRNGEDCKIITVGKKPFILLVLKQTMRRGRLMTLR